ncbi:AFG1-like ATPase-domain-containing protein [Leptodontidium sp. 2 PMI_412]|nr:AFG1-like ATPase-domain-containing protein [Leptodontidium sp. 2 PMI_412]
MERRPRLILPAPFIAGQRRALATVKNVNPDDRGPLIEYDNRVDSGRLRNDEHQRGIIESLQHLHDELRTYHARAITHPTIDSLKPPPKSMLGRLFGNVPKERKLQDIPENLPRGLYLYGDVGSGKTMLMDMFYETLPSSVTSKTRIHFHNFMQDVHKRLHQMKMEHGNDIDAVPFVAADIAEKGNVLCFDEFQCTDVADAMILRRLLEALMSHGVVLVTTSNRHPDDLYRNGIQRESFIPCINLLKNRLHVINLDSPTDYRKIPRPPSGVYHAPLDKHADSHADKWFRFLGDPEQDKPRAETQRVWGREIVVPKVSGRAAMFTFDELIGRPTSAADYIELTRSYDSFIVTNVPGMTHRERDLARRFITFIDAVYESRAKLVLTTAVPLTQLFLSREELENGVKKDNADKKGQAEEHDDLDATMRNLMDDLGLNMKALKNSSIFSGDEERFAFARALSRLSEMGSREWVERGMGLEKDGGKKEKDDWQRVRSKQLEDSM